MADLFEFPYLELKEGENLPIEVLFERALNLPLSYKEPLLEEKQSFTRYRVRLRPHLLVAHQPGKNNLWKNPKEMEELAFSSGHRRILKDLLSI